MIIAPPESTISKEQVQTVFQDNYLSIVEGSVWAAGSDKLLTCADVREALTATEVKACVIFKITEYNGYASRDLWEKLDLWERLP